MQIFHINKFPTLIILLEPYRQNKLRAFFLAYIFLYYRKSWYKIDVLSQTARELIMLQINIILWSWYQLFKENNMKDNRFY